jgi:hypothetical protein
VNIRPSTPQVLRDLADELDREIMPLLSDSTDQIRLHMVMAVLNQCAVRADSEIALMREESQHYAAYGHSVAQATGNADLAAAVAAIEPTSDLHLPAILAEYTRASEAFGTALELALDAGLADLVAQGEELLQRRIANEQQMAGVADVGR